MNDFGQLLRTVERLVDLVAGHTARIVADCRHWLRLLGPLGGALDGLAGELERAAADAERLLRTMLERPGDPVALWLAGERWRVAVAGPVGVRAATFTVDFLHADERWRGPAAEAYKATLPPQREALLELHDVAGSTAGSLREAAAALFAYWTAIASALTGLAAQLATAAAASASPATAAAGAATALAAVSEATAVVTGLTRVLTAELDRVRRTQQGLLDRLTEGTAFPGGRWPVSASTALSDASLTDGDGLDWTLQR